MKILVDLCHPAHVHFFRHAIAEWRRRGHQVLIAARDKDVTLRLLDDYGLACTCLSRARRGAVGQLLELVGHQSALYRLARRERPDVVLGIAGVLSVHASRLLGIPAVAFTDTEHARVSNAMTFPFASAVVTPTCFGRDLGRKHVRYDGYHELAYLHPSRFTPDVGVLDALGLRPDQPYFVVRFVSWGAAHDRGHSGFTLDGQRELVRRLGERGRVVLTSESALPPDLEPYRLRVPPSRIHDVLAHASLYVGEGATMASEAAILGVPSVYVNPLRLGYLEEQERRYGLVRCVADPARAVEQAVRLAGDEASAAAGRAGRARLLAEKIDVTDWLVGFVEGYRSR